MSHEPKALLPVEEAIAWPMPKAGCWQWTWCPHWICRHGRTAPWMATPCGWRTGPVSRWLSASAFSQGTCARIFTGAPMPEGADCVEMQENAVVLADQRVRFSEPLGIGQNIRPQGQETRVGDTVLAAGTRLGPIASLPRWAC